MAESSVEDFQAPSGHRGPAKKEVWLDQVPDVLTIHLQRVRFSKEVCWRAPAAGGRGERERERERERRPRVTALTLTLLGTMRGILPLWLAAVEPAAPLPLADSPR